MIKTAALTLSTLAALCAALPAAAAEEASPLSFNASLTSDYRYRGISQSHKLPALQGGADYAAASGVYVGAWASTIKWVGDFGGNANVELDVYGGWKGEVSKDLTLDVGALTYVYHNNDLNPSANTTEVYAAASWGPATLKYSHSVTNLFGTASSKGSGYLDLSASFDVGSGVTFTPHVGYQKVAHNANLSYTDYSVTVSKTYGMWTPSLSMVATDADKAGYTWGGKEVGKAGLVVAVKAAF